MLGLQPLRQAQGLALPALAAWPLRSLRSLNIPRPPLLRAVFGGFGNSGRSVSGTAASLGTSDKALLSDMAYGFPRSRFYIMCTLYKLPASVIYSELGRRTPSDPFATYASPQHPVRPPGAPRLPPPKRKRQLRSNSQLPQANLSQVKG